MLRTCKSWERRSSPHPASWGGHGKGTAGALHRDSVPFHASRGSPYTSPLTTHHSPLNPHPNQARLTRDELDSLPGHVATRADAARAEVCAICLCEPECGDAHSMLRGPPCWCHSSLPWPPGADCPGSWPRCALGASRCAAQGPMGAGGCGAAVRAGRSRRCYGLTTPPLLHSQVVCTLACTHSFHKACVTQRRRLLEVPPWQCNRLPPRPPGTQGCASGPLYTLERSASRSAGQTPVAAFEFCGFQHPGGCSAHSSARSARRTRWVRRRSS